MKNGLLIIALTIGTLTMANGQTRNDLKGPQAKNYKPWMNKTLPTTIVTNDKKNLKGPEAKNFKAWKDEREFTEQVVVFGDSKPKLKGPEAKNYKPWTD
jgi:hypothetical protein